MKDLKKGVVITMLGVAICRICYVRGFNDAVKLGNVLSKIKENIKEGLSNE